MKRYFALLLAVLFAVGCFSACGTGPAPHARDEDALQIVTTVFPEYDWVESILGENPGNAEVTLLLDHGVDLHSYQPTADDILKISTCDLFVYVGGESDEWVEDALAEAANENMVVINLLETLGDSVKTEEVIEGMEHEHEHEHEEIDDADIQDRTLAQFNGDWQSLLPMLESGSLDEYVEHHAEEHGEPVDEVREEIAENWSCEVEKVSIDGDTITFVYADGTTVSAEYSYAGYMAMKDEDGDITGVRYQFETDGADAPKYVQLNDHGYTSTNEVEHFHLYFGEEGFEALAESESNPFFVPAAFGAEDVLEELMEEEEELDEHVWLSLKNAAVLCDAIADALEQLDSENAETYQANADAYQAQLSALDAEYAAAVSAAPGKTLLFGDRFPFRYLADDYGLDYYAAFAGCSAETEASFETILFLAQKVDELGLDTVLTIEGTDHRIAETIVENTASQDQQILTMDSMQSTTSQDAANGVTYLSVMEGNLDVLKDALKQEV